MDQKSARNTPIEILAREVDEPHVRKLLDATFEVLCAVDIHLDGSDGDVLLFKDFGAEIGYPPGEIPLRLSVADFMSLLHPEDVEAYFTGIQTALATGMFSLEYRHIGPKGEITWWEQKSIPIGYENGHPRWWVGAGRNITQQKLVEISLREAVSELNHLKAELEVENTYLREAYEREFDEIVGASSALKKVLELVRRVAPTTTPVLITGETGTGKELVARAIHQHSQRGGKPMVVVNCAALPATLIESELFGHERGSFTGAIGRRIGRFEFAHGGTLFFDEVGELPLELQAKLLRVLQTGQFERLGSMETRTADVRIIAATNRNLEREVEEGHFRADLYYRLRVFPIHVPPLRERKTDIPLLVSYLVDKKSIALSKKIRRIPPEAFAALSAYDWPGNVRELDNVIERAVILSDGPVFRLDKSQIHSDASRPDVTPSVISGHGTLDEMERTYIQTVCEECNWKIKGPNGAAERLGLHPSTLYFRLKKLGIRKSR